MIAKVAVSNAVDAPIYSNLRRDIPQVLPPLRVYVSARRGDVVPNFVHGLFSFIDESLSTGLWVAGRGRQIGRFGCACASACGSMVRVFDAGFMARLKSCPFEGGGY